LSSFTDVPGYNLLSVTLIAIPVRAVEIAAGTFTIRLAALHQLLLVNHLPHPLLLYHFPPRLAGNH